MRKFLIVLLVLATPAQAMASPGDLVVDGFVESTGAGFRFPDSTVQTTAAASLEARTPISSVPFDISTPGSYYLANNLSLASGTHAITISADDVTLDLNGFLLSGAGSSGSGILVAAADNVTILNGSIQGFGQHGIGGSGNYTRILDIRVVENSLAGLGFEPNDKGQFVTRTTASDNGTYGIRLGEQALVTLVSASSNGLTGINAGDKSLVTLSTVRSNAGDGINVDNQSTVARNTVADNTRNGIRAEEGTRVTGNTVTHNNVEEDTANAGIKVFGGCSVMANFVEDNNENGVLVRLDGSIVVGNSIINTNGNGLRIDDSGNIYADNRLCLNVQTKLVFPGNLDGGGNLECP